MAWTSERVALLRKLWAEGLSAGQIAKQIGGGKSRNAIIGKAFRIGCPHRGAQTSINTNKVRGARIKRNRRDITFIPNNVLKPTKKELLRTELALIAALPPVHPGLTLNTLGANQCRYMNGDPQSDGTFCGRLTASGSWCAQHRKLVYQPSKPKAIVRTVEGDEKRRQLRELARREQFQMGVAV